MRYQEICETPIEDFSVHNMDQEGTFPAADRATLQDPEQVRHIKQRFENVPYTFNLYFVNQPGKNYTVPVKRNSGERIGQTARFTKEFNHDIDKYGGISSPETVQGLLGLKVNTSPDAITLVLLSNANETYSMPITPWIIAHRIGHALSDNRTWTTAFNQLPSDIGSLPIANVDIPLTDLLLMKSARNKTLLPGEAQVEMIAAYILTGEVGMRPPAGVVTTPAMQMAVQTLARRTTRAMDRIFDAAVGQVFIAV